MQVSGSLSSYVTSNMRYIGARLAAGFKNVAMAAEVMGITVEEYQGYETIFGAQLETAHLVARTFGVSTGYLIGSRVVSHREELAHMIALGLAHHQSSRPIVNGTAWETRKLAASLVTIRAFLGFETPAEAAKAMGWPALLYTAHEEGARPLTADRLALYALEYGVRPDTALRGETPTHLWHDLEYPWWRLQTNEEHIATEGLVSPSFDWLAQGSSAEPYLNLPLLEFSGERWELAKERFPLSRHLLPAAIGFVGDTLFGLVDRVNEEVRIIVVDATRAGVDSIWVTLDGDIKIEPEAAETVVDPLHHRPKDRSVYFSTGSFVMEVTVRGLLS